MSDTDTRSDAAPAAAAPAPRVPRPDQLSRRQLGLSDPLADPLRGPRIGPQPAPAPAAPETDPVPPAAAPDEEGPVRLSGFPPTLQLRTDVFEMDAGVMNTEMRGGAPAGGTRGILGYNYGRDIYTGVQTGDHRVTLGVTPQNGAFQLQGQHGEDTSWHIRGNPAERSGSIGFQYGAPLAPMANPLSRGEDGGRMRRLGVPDLHHSVPGAAPHVIPALTESTRLMGDTTSRLAQGDNVVDTVGDAVEGGTALYQEHGEPITNAATDLAGIAAAADEDGGLRLGLNVEAGVRPWSMDESQTEFYGTVGVQGSF